MQGKVVSGIQLARYIGYPTINVEHNGEYDLGVFIIQHRVYGQGTAFVMPDLIEIHFLETVEFNGSTIEVEVKGKIPPTGILKYFYKGLENES